MRQKVEEEVLQSYEMMYRIAFSYVKNEDDAMDIVQESVYKALKSAGKIREERYIKTWLARIVINTSLDLLKIRKREVAMETVEESGREDSYADVDMQRLLKKLNQRERLMIILRYFEGWKISQVAEGMGEKENTVKTVLSRSLKKLKIFMQEEGTDES